MYSITPWALGCYFNYNSQQNFPIPLRSQNLFLCFNFLHWLFFTSVTNHFFQMPQAVIFNQFSLHIKKELYVHINLIILCIYSKKLYLHKQTFVVMVGMQSSLIHSFIHPANYSALFSFIPLDTYLFIQHILKEIFAKCCHTKYDHGKFPVFEAEGTGATQVLCEE